MGTLVNGIKEIFATAKTTGSNVMLCGNDGTPDGHMTMDNLASVLGGLTMKGFFPDLSKLDNLTANDYGMYTTSDALFQGTSGIGVIIHYGYENTRLVQLLLRPGGSIFRQKLGDSWGDWRRYESDIPTFYKNYNDLSSLASALGVQIESFTSNSHYGYKFPTADGFAIKLAINAYSFVLFCLGDSGKLYYKYIWQGSDNMDWLLINVVQK